MTRVLMGLEPRCITLGVEKLVMRTRRVHWLLSTTRAEESHFAMTFTSEGVTESTSSGGQQKWGPQLPFGIFWRRKEESHPLSDTLGRAFGPDVYEGPATGRTVGIFGLTHEQLLASEWVTGDALSVKIKVEVLPPEDGFYTKTMKTSLVDVPAPTICSHFRALLEAWKQPVPSFRSLRTAGEVQM